MACPDGNVWDRNGPTGRACPLCKGEGVMPEEEDIRYCECDLEPVMQEVDSGKCMACGGTL
jgi:hypothetical protein